MHEMGFYVCGLAATQDRACSLAASEQPDVVVMDVCLEGGREGIEPPDGSVRHAEQRWCSSPVTLIALPWSESTSKCRGPLCCRSRSLMLVLQKLSPASFEAPKRLAELQSNRRVKTQSALFNLAPRQMALIREARPLAQSGFFWTQGNATEIEQAATTWLHERPNSGGAL
jgi:DNA-binding NarL/FixJ family response regulator